MAPSPAPGKAHIAPDEVHALLEKHILADGLPMVLDLEKSHGAHLYDSLREREVLDLLTCFATCPIGFNHPKLHTPEFRQRILLAALNKPSNSDFYTTEMAEFVATLSRTVPDSLNHKMFFIEGGALAVENALKTAFDWKVRRNLEAGKGEKGYQVIHFHQAFHGRSGYTLSLTNTADPRKTDYFPKFDWPRVSNPKLSFPLTADILEQVEVAEKQSLDEIKRALRENRDDIAALIMEPIQGEGGDNHFREEFLRQLRELADEEEFLLVFDEVQTGFGATGKWWAFEHFDVQPDIFAFGKKTQVCGICASDRIDDVDSVFKVSSRINSTWGGNLVDMVRCQRYVEIIEEDDLLANAATVGAELLAGLEQLETTFPDKVSNARGRGMMVAFDLPDAKTRDAVLQEMVEVGVMALSSGVRAIRFRPPLCLSSDEAAEGIRRLELALQGGSR
ncbi:MAG: L-lysine 6-transaminase [Acidobacteria bacterium]|nr:MAG: L-lysine 6-transaminase [Acidobacteriota bacterium]